MIVRKGAEGDLPLPAAERIEILALLAATDDSDLRAKARATFQSWDQAEVREVLSSPSVAPQVLRFASEQILAGYGALKETLLSNPRLPDEIRNQLQSAAPMLTAEKPEETARELLAKLSAALEQGDDAAVHALTPEIKAPAEAVKASELTGDERQTLLQKIGRMSAVEKIKAALTGNMETRVVLIRDSNKIVARAVLQSPKVNETELESYAAAKNVSEEVLRLIAVNRKFMKSYVVLRALVNNPRAPIDITLPLIKHLKERDVKGVALNHNIPDAIRTTAIKLIKQREEALKPKLPTKH